MSDQMLSKIEEQLALLNANLADANDIAMLTAYASMPANLDNESREALAQLRDRMMERARKRCQ